MREELSSSRREITRMLRALASGEGDAAAEELFGLVHEELRRIARREMAGERRAHTLQPTALVHEAWLRLAGPDLPADSRGHFYAAAARAMRRILVDHARRRLAAKRGGVAPKPSPPPGREDGEPDLLRILAVDEALSRMEKENPRGAAVVRLRFFAGLDVEETADALGVSGRTVRREWLYARARLYRDLGSGRE